ncbi:Cytotoxic translational repressor [Candidatus Desulfosporosinus infrequens]|uniref:Cytotoxic translational repressor n=1 Tax=Candidatus Desulfosporosinus infrequens TaxID=2043169 RepID=A0A2U3L2Y6_9FIRM|nr:Cytotoxic translational repressor [Candidatus Desulfosporosinus infrequens]
MASDSSIIFEWSPWFERAFKKLPKEIKLLFGDKIIQFEDNWQHPSLRTKHIQGTDHIWEASLNMSIRFTFEWITDVKGGRVCLMRNIGDHDHCLRPPF